MSNESLAKGLDRYSNDKTVSYKGYVIEVKKVGARYQVIVPKRSLHPVSIHQTEAQALDAGKDAVDMHIDMLD